MLIFVIIIFIIMIVDAADLDRVGSVLPVDDLDIHRKGVAIHT